MGSLNQHHLDSIQPPYPRSSSSSHTPFRLDEGFSEETASQDENGRNMFAATAAQFSDWVMAQNEAARAEIAYEVLRTLRTSQIAAVVERLTPLLHMDPLEKLPPEITCEIFSYLDAQTLLTASLASHTWRARIMDPMLWQDLYRSQGWGLNAAEIKQFETSHSAALRPNSRKARGQFSGQPQLKKRATSDWLDAKGRRISADVSHWREQHGVVEADTDMRSDSDDQEMQDAPGSSSQSPFQRPNKRHSQDSGDEMYYSSPIRAEDRDKRREQQPYSHEPPFRSKLTVQDPHGADRLNWMHLYKQRQKLEQNWLKGRYIPFQLPHPSHPNEAHTECVYTIQFYGKWLVSGSRDKTLRIWDLETRRLRGRPLVGHSQSVLCLQFDPTENEDIIISGSSDASVIVWQFSTGKKIHEISSAHDESVLNLRFDKRYLVTCSKDRRIKIWNRHALVATDPDYPKISRDSTARVPSYIVNTSNMEPSLLEARVADGAIRALKPYMLLLTLVGHGAAVNAIQINGDLIVSASGDRLIKIWSSRNGKLLRTLQGHQKGIACVQFDSKRIVSGSSDNTVRIYDPYTGAEVAELKGHTNLVRTVQAGFGDLPGADGEYNVRARRAERKYLEDLSNGLIVEGRNYSRELRRGAHGTSRLALGAKLPPGGGGSKWGRIVSGSYDESIIIWRKNSGGDWVIGQVLRQNPATREAPAESRRRGSQPAAATAANAVASVSQHVRNQSAANVTHGQQAASSSSNQGPAGAAHPAVMSASQIVQQTVGTSIASLGAGISNVMGISRVLNAPLPEQSNSSRATTTQSFNSSLTISGSSPQALSQAAMAHTQAAVNQAVQQALAQAGQGRPSSHNHPLAQGSSQHHHQEPHHQTTATFPANALNHQANSHNLPNQPHQNALPQHHPPHATPGHQQQQPTHAAQGQGHHQQQHSSGSRVFKLQFDARRIVSCSQDSRIVGWDFANGDPEIMEACRFFAGP
ncbi:hypothetical protein ABEF93_005512 [Exophiala dermatitidis]